MSTPETVDDVEPLPSGRDGTVPGAPVSAAVQPAHVAPAARPAQSAQSRAAATYLEAGTVIDGKYAIIRLLGQGGMGVVYLARDVHTGIDVVLKSMRAELAHRADVRARTLAEGRVLGQIDHPNVVHLKAVVVDEKGLWLVMQYIEGESLERTIERCVEEKRPMPLAEALRCFRQITSGIGAAHAEGVIHRDLKPANVLIRKKDGVAKVTDFGIAKAEHDAGAGRVQTKGVIGSVWYMSPEQVTGRRDLDKRVDIYALGILLYQMLAGRVPFDADSDYEVMRMHAEAPLPRVSDLRPDLPAGVDALLQKLCAKGRDDRLATCEDVLRAVDAIEAEIAGKSSPGSHTQVPVVAAKSAPEPDLPAPTRHESSPPAEGPAAQATRSDDTAVDPPGAPAEAPPRRIGRWIALGLTLAAIGAAATLVATGTVKPSRWFGGAAPTARPSAGASSGKPSATAGPTAPTAAPVKPTGPAPGASAPVTASAAPAPFDSLEGEWLVSGSGVERVLVAVKVADTLEFRVKDPVQFAPAAYEAGEARFVLRRIPDQQTVFALEDRLRPNPPIKFPFNRERARPSCQEVRTEAGGLPLRATLDAGRLSVDLMKLEPSQGNFLFDKGETVSCVGLSKLKAAKVVSVLTRK